MNGISTAELLVAPMTAGDVRPLFPLMRAAEPELTLGAWLIYSRRIMKLKAGGRAGTMVARRQGHRFPCGAVMYRVDRDLNHRRLLTAEHFVALDLLHPHAVLAALFDALGAVAAECGCGAMRSILHDGRPDLLAKLWAAGHRRDGVTLTKSFAAG